MSKSKKNKWRLNPKEVTWGWNGSTSGKSGQFERRLKLTSCRMTLTHTPTEISVKGEVPEGHYSKKAMQQNRKKLVQSLFLELEGLVAKKLKIKGR